MWKKTMVSAMLLAMLAGCGDGAPQEKPAGEPEEVPQEAEVQGNANTSWLPEGTELCLSQTEPLPELAERIGEIYQIPEEEWGDTRYYYEYVDLNDDGVEEILAVVIGMYTSGSGGDSALLVQPAGGMNVTQRFTLVRMPILISDQKTDGAHDLIVLRSGGGSEPAYVRLTCTDGIYSNPADGEVLESLEGITGRAILCDDVMAEDGTVLTLAGPR